MYGLPKIHKTNCPLRPIVSSLKAPNKNLDLFLAQILAPQVGLVSQSHINKTTDFLDFLKQDTNDQFNHMLSFDVVSLFTNIPLDRVLDFIKTKAEEGVFQFQLEINVICRLIKLCVTDTCFSFNSKHYVQTFGVAMGSSLSPILANLYMEFFETALLPNINITDLKVVSWKRYVDDIFSLIECNDWSKIEEFLSQLNSQENSIKFTVENSENMKIPFLDLVVIHTDNIFETKVYRKATHTNTYVHFFSHHSKSIKMGILVGLFLRALRYCDPEFFDNEVQFLRNSFSKLGYPYHFITQSLSKAKRIFYNNKEKRPWNPHKATILKIPFVPEFQEKVANNLDDKDYKFVPHFENTIRKKVCSNKLETSTQDNIPGVYIIPCKDCNQTYVGESGRNLDIRIKEHKKAVTSWDTKSAIANHCWNNNHRMDFDNSKIVYKCNDIKKRRLIEGVIIDNISTLQGNKSFHKVDKITSQSILREANLNPLIEKINSPNSDNISNFPPIHPPGQNHSIIVNSQDLGSQFVQNNLSIVRRSSRLNRNILS